MLARWSGWGALPEVFDPARDRSEPAREELRELLTDAEYAAAARTTLNAHYTDAGIAAAVWDTLTGHGFADTAGRVLEPGCGAGVFLALAPDSARQLVGVELDPVTAAIAAALNPHAEIRAESFRDTRLPAGSFDLVIGNVPFGKTVLHDPTHNPGRHSLHNYFLIKSLHLTRPGGVVAALSSHWTLDAANPAARREIDSLAELVAAVRLPTSAHRAAAGTDVVTDLLLLRRRNPGEEPDPDPGWATTTALLGDPAAPVRVNDYYRTRPDRVIGTIGTRSGPHGPQLDVDYDGDVAAGVRNRLERALTQAPAAGPTWRLFGPATEIAAPPPVAARDAPADAQDGHLAAAGDGGFTVVEAGRLTPHDVPASQAAELRALIRLRDATLTLLAAEAATRDDTDTLAGLRAQLGHRYDAYLAVYGPLNRVTLRRTGRVDPGTGEQRLARIRPPQGRFRDDPHAPAVYALEEYDPVAGTARRAAIFTERVIAPRTPRLGADTPADAVAICLDTHGQVRLQEIAHLLGTTPDEARTAIRGLVFDDPDTPERLIPAAEYLSGNVRAKLGAAQAAAEQDGDTRWAANITALREVIPPDLTPAEIDARLGASWIDADTVAAFLREVLDDPTVRVENPGGSTWTVRGNRHTVLATSTYGTERVSAIELAQAALEMRQIKVTDEIDGGRRIVNLTETVAAQEKTSELAERFADWLWTDPDRAQTLTRRYNDTFNTIVLRSYDGERRQLPGLALTFTLRPHQHAAIARIVAEPAVLLGHDVGAGKTAAIVGGAMELRRLGLARKPAVVVPNHMLEQFTREWLQLYPQARILAAGVEDLARARRRLFLARAATGDWDGILLSRSAFERIPLSPAAQRDYLNRELDTLRGQLERSRAAGGLTVKRLEAALQRGEERLRTLLDTVKDLGISFEETGIDYLFLDEAHGYKNLHTESNIPNVSIDGSQRASDLDMKMDHLRGRHGNRIATFATATPIANSVAEAYVMQRYLRPDVLRDAGIPDFDSWAATFGEVTTDLELAPDGSRFRMNARFAKFRNVPELLRMWHLSADIKTAEDLQLPTPALRGGHAETVVVPAGPQLTAFMAELARRADRISARTVDPTEDNMLRVATHGRLAALDLRLLDPAAGANVSAKLATAADRIAAIHSAHADRRYGTSSRPGALQLVFCDLGTPTGRRGSWNAYDELRALLADRGVPADSVRFVHDARNDREKAELFAACRNGRVSVLIGSTERMGVGTNVQARAVALHHLDCPWRPADLAQREGRILRQGNLNPQVEIIRYVTRSSFDAYLWQTVERKARFIGQVMRGRLDVREIEDIGDTALSYSEVKALATGDPRILDKARADAELTRLERLERAHTRNHRALRGTVTTTDQRLPALADSLDQLRRALPRAVDTRGDAFAMTVGGRRYRGRGDAALALRDQLSTLLATPAAGTAPPVPVGEIGGFPILATPHRLPEQPQLRLELAGVPRSGLTVDASELRADKPLGILTRLENRAAAIPATLADVEQELRRLTAERDRAHAELATPFPHAAALAEAQARRDALAAELADTSGVPAATVLGGSDEAMEQRWRHLCTAIDLRVVDDPHWPALAAALTRAEQAGTDVATVLRDLTDKQALPDDHPARSLHYRLIDSCEAALTAPPDALTPPPAVAVSAAAEIPAGIVQPAPGPRR